MKENYVIFNCYSCLENVCFKVQDKIEDGTYEYTCSNCGRTHKVTFKNGKIIGHKTSKRIGV